jgi:mRNA interferase MazF
MTPRRGEIWWIRLSPAEGSEISKTRPCIILSATVINERRRTVVVVPLSSSPQPAAPLLVPMTCEGRNVVAVTDQIRAIAKERLQERIAQISPGELEALAVGIRRILELS